MLAPVALFVYKRYEHTKRMLESLANNLLADQTEVFIFSDGAKKQSDQEAVEEVRALIHDPLWKKSFADITIIEADRNKGLADSIINGVSEVLNRYGKIVVVEDDLILSKEFLRYMNKALDYYESVSDVWSITGYSFPMKALKNYPHDVFYGYRGCSWGWGTWKNRWDIVDWKCKEYKAFAQDPKRIRQFNRGGSDLTPMLVSQMDGKIDSWAVRWCFAQSMADMFTVYPKISYVANEGCDGSGTHSGYSTSFSTELIECKEAKMERLPIEPKIAREFWRKYSDTLNKKIRRNLKKILLFCMKGNKD